MGTFDAGDELTLKSAGQQDAPLISALAYSIWPTVYAELLSPGQIAYMLDLMYRPTLLEQQLRDGQRYLLALWRDTPVGFAGFAHHHQGRSLTRLHKLYVLPELHGRGTGTRLLNAVVEESRAAGDTAVELNVNRHNPALHFYTRHGFTVVRDEVIDIGQGYVMDDHVMVRTIATP